MTYNASADRRSSRRVGASRQARVHRRRHDAHLRRAAHAGQPGRRVAQGARRRPRAPRAARPRRHPRPSRSCSSARCGSARCPSRSPPSTRPTTSATRRGLLATVVATDAEMLPRLRPGARRPRPALRGPAVARQRASSSSTAGSPPSRRSSTRRRQHRDDMAFWLSTSGSTGKPKGVVHLHHDIEVTCETFAREVLGLREDDVTFSTTKLFHAYGLGQRPLVPAVVRRDVGPHAGPTEARRRSSPRCASIARPCSSRSRRSTAPLVRDESADGALDSVRLCVSAAEALPPQTFDRWQERFGAGDHRRHRLDRDAAHLLLQPAGRGRGGHDRPAVPGYELRIVDEEGEVLDGPAVGGLEVRGDSSRRSTGTAREDQGVHARRLVRERRPLRAPRGRRVRVRGPDGRHAQGRRPLGLADRHGARPRRAPARARRRRRRHHGRGRQPHRRLRRVREGDAGRRRARRRAARVVQGAPAPLRVPARRRVRRRAAAHADRQGPALPLRELAARRSVA